MSISPKLCNSTPRGDEHERWRRRHERPDVPDVIRRLIREHAYQVKFVVDDPRDLGEIDRYLKEFPEIDRNGVMLMPQGTDAVVLQRTRTWLEPYCHRHGFRFCPASTSSGSDSCGEPDTEETRR